MLVPLLFLGAFVAIITVPGLIAKHAAKNCGTVKDGAGDHDA